MASFGKAAPRRFCADEFENPDSFFRPVYVWAWNDRLSRGIFSRQLKDMKTHGVGGVWPLPQPTDFRPNFMRTALEPDYLSDGFMKLHTAMVKEAGRLDMRVWLYDEGGWPSGGVCGRIVRAHPALAQQWIERRDIAPKPGDVVKISEDCLSAFLYEDGAAPRQLKPGTEATIARANVRLEIFHVVQPKEATLATPPYPDLLNPKSTRTFIRMTHEKYKKWMGRYFGNVACLMFTDEPKVPNPPWTDGLARDFRKKKGYDIRDHLPAILNPDHAEGMLARVDFYDWWSRRFADAFFGQLQKWCRKNHILFAGHLGGEDGTLLPRVHGYGHPLRMHRKMDIPGIDTIWRGIFPGPQGTFKSQWGKHKADVPCCVNHHYPKLPSSVAHQDGKRWALTESFAAYGGGLTPEEMKWILDFQYVRGLNLVTVGGYLLSTKDHFMGSIRPFFGPPNPLWKYMDAFNAYAARLGYLLSIGKPAIDLAVYYPIRDIWAGGPKVKEIAESHDAVAKALLENQCDFDLVDDDVLEKASTRVANGRLRIGPMAYRTVCVSRCEWMSEKTKAKLSEFASKGGKVLRVDDADGLRKLADRIEPLIEIRPKNAAIKVCKRKLSRGSLYFITNEGEKPAACNVAFDESSPAYRLDPETGDCYRSSGASYSGGKCRVSLHLPFAGSCVILFTTEKVPVKALRAETGGNLILLDKGWTCRRVKSYRLGEHDFEIAKLNGPAGPVKLGDWRGKLGKGFSGEAEYRISFPCSREQAAEARVLDLGAVHYACEVILNGKSLGRKAWRPFAFGVEGLLKEGKNDLRALVTNTISNQYATSKVLAKWPDSVMGPYHRICRALEKDNLAGGLYGPVKVLS